MQSAIHIIVKLICVFIYASFYSPLYALGSLTGGNASCYSTQLLPNSYSTNNTAFVFDQNCNLNGGVPDYYTATDALIIFKDSFIVSNNTSYTNHAFLLNHSNGNTLDSKIIFNNASFNLQGLGATVDNKNFFRVINNDPNKAIDIVITNQSNLSVKDTTNFNNLLYFKGKTSFTLNGGSTMEFINNKAKGYSGGGLFIDGNFNVLFDIDSSLNFTGNSLGPGVPTISPIFGPAMAFKGDGAISILGQAIFKDNKIFETSYNNNDFDRFGGVLFIQGDKVNVNIGNNQGIIFENNISNNGGGALAISSVSDAEGTYANVNLFGNVVFRNNSTQQFRGGGWSQRGTGTVNIGLNKTDNIQFIGNFAGAYGGGFFSQSHDIKSSQIKQHIYLSGEILFRDNVTTGNGGGMSVGYNSRISTTDKLVNLSFINNKSTFRGGGLFYHSRVDTNLTGLNTVTGNISEKSSGGGIFIQPLAKGYIPTGAVVVGMRIIIGPNGNNIANYSNNSAFSFGGAFQIVDTTYEDQSILFFNNPIIFADNKANIGGALSTYLKETNIGNNQPIQFNNNQATVYGGAAYIKGYELTTKVAILNIQSNVQFNTNKSLNNSGGAIVAEHNINSYFPGDNIQFNNNSAQVDAGALLIQGGNFTANAYLTGNNLLFFQNIATTGNGGAITTKGNGDLILGSPQASLTLNNNKASNGNGGAIFVLASNNTLTKNIKLQGQAVLAYNQSKQGGAYAAVLSSSNAGLTTTLGLNSTDSFEIRNNQASGSGGALYFYNNSTTQANNLFLGGTLNFLNNTAAELGGAIYTYNLNSIVFNNLTQFNMLGNEAKKGGGFYLYKDPTQAKLEVEFNGNSTFHLNKASQEGGVFYLQGATQLRFSNSSSVTNFTQNASQNNGGVFYLNTEINDEALTLNYAINATNNSTNNSGGVLYSAGQGNITVDTKLENYFTQFSNNIANQDGGVFYIDATNKPTTLRLKGYLTLSNNSTVNGRGGSIYLQQGQLILTNAYNGNILFTGNQANGNSEAIYGTLGSTVLSENDTEGWVGMFDSIQGFADLTLNTLGIEKGFVMDSHSYNLNNLDINSGVLYLSRSPTVIANHLTGNLNPNLKAVKGSGTLTLTDPNSTQVNWFIDSIEVSKNFTVTTNPFATLTFTEDAIWTNNNLNLQVNPKTSDHDLALFMHNLTVNDSKINLSWKTGGVLKNALSNNWITIVEVQDTMTQTFESYFEKKLLLNNETYTFGLYKFTYIQDTKGVHLKDTQLATIDENINDHKEQFEEFHETVPNIKPNHYDPFNNDNFPFAIQMKNLIDELLLDYKEGYTNSEDTQIIALLIDYFNGLLDKPIQYNIIRLTSEMSFQSLMSNTVWSQLLASRYYQSPHYRHLFVDSFYFNYHGNQTYWQNYRYQAPLGLTVGYGWLTNPALQITSYLTYLQGTVGLKYLQQSAEHYGYLVGSFLEWDYQGFTATAGINMGIYSNYTHKDLVSSTLNSHFNTQVVAMDYRLQYHPKYKYQQLFYLVPYLSVNLAWAQSNKPHEETGYTPFNLKLMNLSSHFKYINLGALIEFTNFAGITRFYATYQYALQHTGELDFSFATSTRVKHVTDYYRHHHSLSLGLSVDYTFARTQHLLLNVEYGVSRYSNQRMVSLGFKGGF